MGSIRRSGGNVMLRSYWRIEGDGIVVVIIIIIIGSSRGDVVVSSHWRTEGRWVRRIGGGGGNVMLRSYGRVEKWCAGRCRSNVMSGGWYRNRG